MTNITSANGIRILTPSEGRYLTNGETYSTKVFLGKNASIEDWTEVNYMDENILEPDLYGWIKEE